MLARIESWASHRADRVHVNSDAVGHTARASEGLDVRKLARIYNGVDAERFSPQAPELDCSGRAIGEGPVLVVIANLHPYKGHAILLRAMPRVLEDHPHTRIILVGEDRGLGGDLARQAETLGVDRHVEFLGHRDDVREILSRADLVVQASLQEGFPNAVLEAMAMGKPIVATRVGGTPEAIEDGVSGLLVGAGDASALSLAILRLLGEPNLAESLAQQARQRVLEQFSLDRILDQLECLYVDVVWPETSRNGEGDGGDSTMKGGTS